MLCASLPLRAATAGAPWIPRILWRHSPSGCSDSNERSNQASAVAPRTSEDAAVSAQPAPAIVPIAIPRMRVLTASPITPTGLPRCLMADPPLTRMSRARSNVVMAVSVPEVAPRASRTQGGPPLRPPRSLKEWCQDAPQRPGDPAPPCARMRVALARGSTVEHLTLDQGVIGSNPIAPANSLSTNEPLQQMPEGLSFWSLPRLLPRRGWRWPHLSHDGELSRRADQARRARSRDGRCCATCASSRSSPCPART